MATEEEMIKPLLVSLQDIGFGKEEVADKVKAIVYLNLPCSWLRLRKDYGTETMFIELQLTGNPGKGLLAIEKYNAIYRRPVYTKVKMENGVDIAALENRMQHVDWTDYYRWKTEGLLPQDFLSATYMEETIAMLHKLAESEAGADVCNLLLYKYLPDYLNDSPATLELKNRFETRQEFPVDGERLCPVKLAYHLLSGRLDDLQDAIEALLAGWKPATDLRAILEKELSRDPESFQLKLDFQLADGLVRAVIPVFKAEGYYDLDSYSITLTRYPEAAHGNYNGVETWDLEQTMQRMDWQQGKVILPVAAKKEAALFRDWSSEVEVDLERLWKNGQGILVASILVHRYLQDNAYMISKVPENVLEIMDTFHKTSFDIPAGVKLPVVYNLTEGRWLPKQVSLPWEEESNRWLKLNDGVSSISEESFIEIEGPTRLELYRLLQHLPFYNFVELDMACDSLYRGDLARVKLGEGVEVLLEANPEKNTINVYSTDMRPIPVNLRFDPQWEPGTGMGTAGELKSKNDLKPKPGSKDQSKGL